MARVKHLTRIRGTVRSTGPRIAAGKAQKALTHGLLSQEALLPTEDSEAFEGLAQALRRLQADGHPPWEEGAGGFAWRPTSFSGSPDKTPPPVLTGPAARATDLMGRCDLSTYAQLSTSLKSNALARFHGRAVKKRRHGTMLAATSAILASIVTSLHCTCAETPVK